MDRRLWCASRQRGFLHNPRHLTGHGGSGGDVRRGVLERLLVSVEDGVAERLGGGRLDSAHRGLLRGAQQVPGAAFTAVLARRHRDARVRVTRVLRRPLALPHGEARDPKDCPLALYSPQVAPGYGVWSWRDAVLHHAPAVQAAFAFAACQPMTMNSQHHD